MTTYTPINKSGNGSLILAETPGRPPKCVAINGGPGHWERTVKDAKALQAEHDARQGVACG